jgi:hypothetical protein
MYCWCLQSHCPWYSVSFHNEGIRRRLRKPPSMRSFRAWTRLGRPATRSSAGNPRRRSPDAGVHGRCPVVQADVATQQSNLLTVAGHKLYAPNGVGSAAFQNWPAIPNETGTQFPYPIRGKIPSGANRPSRARLRSEREAFGFVLVAWVLTFFPALIRL